MTTIDWVILAVVIFSVAYGVWRGLVREVFALAGWIAAFVLAALLGASAATWMPASWGESARSIAGHVAVFVLVLVIGGLAGWLVSRIVRAVGLGVVDRMLGGIFGAARGVLVVFALAILASLTTLPRSDAWAHSILIPYVRAGLHAVRPWLPEGAARVVNASIGSRIGLTCGAPPRFEGVGICAGSSAS